MKTTTLFISVIFASIILLIVIISSTTVSNEGPHGGKLQASENYFIEVKVTDNAVYAYLLNKQKKSLNNTGIGCDMQFIFPDTTQVELTLQPFKTDGFNASTSLKGYSSFRVAFDLSGKTVSSIFTVGDIMVKGK